MLEPDNIRAIGDKFSMLGFDGASGGASGVVFLFRGGGIIVLGGSSLCVGRSGDGSLGGGDAGNLKLCEMEPDGFRVPVR